MSQNSIVAVFLICLGSFLIAITTSAPADNRTARRNCFRDCQRLYLPICGTDGITYDNECFFGVANCLRGRRRELQVVQHTACTDNSRCLKPCARLLRPVCGDNGETYPNECELKNGNCFRASWDPVRKIRDGRCGDAQSSDCPRACTFEYRPVCGSDGVTYPTRCVMKAENCLKPKRERPTVVYEGECVVETNVAATAPGNPVTSSGPGVNSSGPAVAPSGQGVTSSGPSVTPTGPAVTPSDAAVTPSGPAVTQSGPAGTPSGLAVTPSGPAVTPSGPAVTPSGPGVTTLEPAVTT